MNRRSSSISLLGALAVALAGGLAVLSPTSASSAPPPAPPAPLPALSTTPFGPGVVDLASGLDTGAALAAGTDLPTDSVVLDGRLYFAASRTDSGSELWVTDGTPAGTRLLRDIAPGVSSSWPRKLTVVGERIYFGADDGVSGRELWSTDGTAAGTTRVADIRPGAEGSDPDELTLVG